MLRDLSVELIQAINNTEEAKQLQKSTIKTKTVGLLRFITSYPLFVPFCKVRFACGCAGTMRALYMYMYM